MRFLSKDCDGRHMKILQYGCLGTFNYGDEVGARNIRKIVLEAKPNTEFLLIGHCRDLIIQNHPEIEKTATWSDKEGISNLCQESDLFIYGAGTVFTNDLLFNMDFILKELHCPILAWAVGCHEINKDSLAFHFAKRAKVIGVRDHSIQELERFGFDNLLSVPDPMLLEGDPNAEKKHNAITISWGLTGEPEDIQKSVLNKLAGIVSRFPNEKWITLPAAWNEKGGLFDEDRILHRKLADLCEIETVTPENFTHLSTLISESKILITSRLHVGVVGFSANSDVYWFGPYKNRVVAESLSVPKRFLGDYSDFEGTNVGRLPIVQNPPYKLEDFANILHPYLNL